jgi:hypothetical protein
MSVFYNVDHGFVDALLRGHRATFLADTDYQNLRDCRRIEGACAPTKEDGPAGPARGRRCR